MTRRAAAFWTAAGLWLWMCGPARAAVTLTAAPQQGGRNIDFGDADSLGPNGEPESDTVTRQVRISIASTSSSSYKVFMRINEPWRNLPGEELPMENVQFFVSEASAGAVVRFPNPTPMTVGEQEILLFQNAPDGTTTSVVNYTIHVPVGQEAGDYRTTVSFRVVSQ